MRRIIKSLFAAFIFLLIAYPVFAWVNVQVSADPTAISGDGVSTSTITATVKTPDGSPWVGHNITFSISPQIGSVNPSSASINSSGQAISTYTSGIACTTITITATDTSVSPNIFGYCYVSLLDTEGPTGTIKINDDAQYTKIREVTLDLSATDTLSGVSQMQFSNDGINWLPVPAANYATSYYPWTLSDGDGTKTVYAQFSDFANNWSTAVSDDIILDTTAPEGTIKINNDAQYTKLTQVSLTLSATDQTSGLDKMQFSNDGSNWSDPEPYNTSKQPWDLLSGDGEKTVYVKFRDIAGNWTQQEIKDTVILDTTAPAVTITSPDNNSVSTVSPITVSGTIDDNAATVIVKVNDDVEIPAQVSNRTFTAEVPLDEGPNTIVAIATDPATNQTTSDSRTVTYQPQAGLTIDITSHQNNDKVSTSPITISGTVSDNEATVTVKGITATVENNIFTAQNISLYQGSNIIIARAVKDTEIAEDTINVIYDPTAPFTPAVIDDGRYTTPATQLHAYWIAGDLESEITENQYSIGTVPGETDVLDWTTPAVPTDTEVTHTGLSLTHGQTYYFNVKSKNGAGTWSEVGSSDGIIVNAHVPVINSVTPQDNSTFFTKTPVTITVDAQDSDGDPLEYRFLVDDDIVQDWSISPTYNWTALPTTKLIRKITCQVRDDKQGQASQTVNYNVEIDLNDTTPPSTPIVTTDEYSNSLTELHASWTAEDQETGIAEFQYSIGTTQGATDVVDWTSAGTNTEMTHYGLILIEGQAYYFNVRAENRVALTSPEGYSSVNNATQKVILRITSPQDNALIFENQYAIQGTANGATEVIINNKTFPVNPDGTFTSPILIAPGAAARKQDNNEDLTNYIIMNYPGPTAITATAGASSQRQDITVYCYQFNVSSDSFSHGDGYPGYSPDVDIQLQSWNNNTLVQCPFSGWADLGSPTRQNYNGGAWQYSSYPQMDYYDEWREADYFENSEENWEDYTNTDMKIHTLPPIRGQVKPMFLVFRNCDFRAYPNEFALSQYAVNGQPLKMLYGTWDNESSNACYVILNDYSPDSDLQIQVTMPTYQHQWPDYVKGFSAYVNTMRVRLNSIKADNKSQDFIFGETDIGNPCTDKDAPALIVFYKDVIDSNFNVMDFYVNLTQTPIIYDKRVKWVKQEGPDSGTLNNADHSYAYFSNPKQGGLYEFDVAAAGKATKTYMLLPLAGADIINWLSNEINEIGPWTIEKYKQTVKGKLYLIRRIRALKVFTTFVLTSKDYDYIIIPKNATGTAPCERLWKNKPEDIYGYITVDDVVVHGSKIADMLWALFGRYWGYSTERLKELSNRYDILTKGQPDSFTAQYAIELAGRIFDNPTADIRTILTKGELRQLQDPTLYEEIFWPCPDLPDMDKSSFATPR